MPPRDPGPSPGPGRPPVVAWSVVVIGLALAGVAVAAKLSDLADRRPADPVVADALEAVRDRLRDPASAEFSDVRRADPASFYVCGRVNARNGFGGMTGRQRFVAAGNLGYVEDDFENEGEFADVWAESGCDAGDVAP